MTSTGEALGFGSPEVHAAIRDDRTAYRRGGLTRLHDRLEAATDIAERYARLIEQVEHQNADRTHHARQHFAAAETRVEAEKDRRRR